MSALWQYGSALLQAGRTADADAVIERYQAAAARLRHTGADVPLGWWRFMRAISRDDPAAKELGDAALDLHRRTSVVSLEELTGIHAIRTAPVGSEVPPDVVASPAVRRNPAFRKEVAYGLLESGDLETAVRLLGHEPATDAPHFAALASDCLQTVVYAAAQLLPQTRGCLTRIQPWSGDVVIWGSADHLGAVDFFVAQAVLALGYRYVARAYAAAAVDLCVRVGNRPWERRARCFSPSLGQLPGSSADHISRRKVRRKSARSPLSDSGARKSYSIQERSMNAYVNENQQVGGQPVVALRTALDALGRSLAGRVVLPGDPDWDAARTAWNVAVPQNPLAVVEIADDGGRPPRRPVGHRPPAADHRAACRARRRRLPRRRAAAAYESSELHRDRPGRGHSSSWRRGEVGRVAGRARRHGSRPSSLGAVPIRPSSA